MEAILNELKRAEEAGEGLMEGAEEKMEALVEKAEAEFHKAAKRIEKITAEAEDDSPGRAMESHGDGQGTSRKTMNSFVAKAMAAAEGGGHDAKQIDAMLYGLSIEQRMAVKMQMVKAGML